MPPQIDLEAIDNRLSQLVRSDQATSYVRQKDSLQKELAAFLLALPGQPGLMTATPEDLTQFLVFKGQNGKAQVYTNGCLFLGQKGVSACGRPMRLSFKTIVSYVGKLRGIFSALGRDDEWDARLRLGNPAVDKRVRDYFVS